MMKTFIEDDAVVLFQGDSITDSNRNRDYSLNKYLMGAGYAFISSSWFQMTYPEKRVHFINRGVNGDMVSNLSARWQEDCLNLKPTWVSILIGINEVSNKYRHNTPTATEVYEEGYRKILDQVKTKLGAKIILCEPFVFPVDNDKTNWHEDLEPKIEVVQKLSIDYGALLVPLNSIFNNAIKVREAAYWTTDGIHPTPAGHALIAKEWLKTVRAI